MKVLSRPAPPALSWERNHAAERPRATLRNTRSRLIAGASILALGAAGAIATPGALATTTPADKTVRVWVTEGSSSLESGPRLARQADLAWAPGTPPASDEMLTFTPAVTYQSMTGFGASFTDSATSNVMRLDESTRSALMTDLFSPTSGIGLSILRQPLGASDFVDPQGTSGAGAFYTYQTNYNSPIDISRDAASLNLVKRAKTLRGQMTVIGSPWSPPAHMRNATGTPLLGTTGGPLLSSQESAYATYLRQVVQAYGAEGVGIDYLTVQNEPLHKPAYPGMEMLPAQQASVVTKLSQELTTAGLGTKILTYDHNWDIPSKEWDDASWSDPASPNPAYPAAVLAASAGAGTVADLPNVAGTALHCYEGLPDKAGNSSLLHNRYPNLGVYFTECSGTVTGESTFRATMEWHASRYIFPTLRNWSKSLVFWNMALDEDNGPIPTGVGVDVCDHCSAIVTVKNNASQGYEKNAGYYLLGHFAKFVAPGAVRVESNDVTVPMGGGNNDTGVHNVVFRNPNGTYAAVLYNDTQSLTDPGASAKSVTLTGPDGSVQLTLPGNSMATLTWGTPAVDPGPGDGTPKPVPTFKAATAPRVSGTTRVGQRLTATAGTYTLAPTSVSYQWRRGTANIRGATSSRYVLKSADRGKRISVRVTARRGSTTVTHTSAATRAIALGRLSVKTRAQIRRGNRVAKRVTAKTRLKVTKGRYSQAGVKVRYQWLRNGRAIKKATKATYRTTARDRGRRITVRVRVTKTGFRNLTVRTAAVRVR